MSPELQQLLGTLIPVSAVLLGLFAGLSLGRF
jgi:hypothetical protein